MQKQEVRAFKNELRNYTYYCHRITTLDESIEFMYERLGGVRGIDPSKEPLHTAPNKDYEYMLREQIERYEESKALYVAKRDYIDKILGEVPNTLREALKSVYINGKRIDMVAVEYNLSANGLIYQMNKAIELALQ